MKGARGEGGEGRERKSEPETVSEGKKKGKISPGNERKKVKKRERRVET